MAHELTINKDNKAEMFYYGEEPWHGLGTKVETALTAYEAIEAASLNWTVAKVPIFYQDYQNDKFIKANEILDGEERQMNLMIRTDNSYPLGLVGKDYQPIQNSDAFAFMDSVIMDASAKYHTAGSLRNGRAIWALLKLPDYIKVGKKDTVEKYLLLINKHDGLGKAKVLFTGVRVVCQNTLSLALGTAQTSVNIVHTGSIESKISKARKVLALANNFFTEQEATFNKMLSTSITDETLKVFLRDIFPQETDYAEGEIALCERLYHEGAGHELAEGSLWGAYNAVTEYADHHRVTDPNEDQYFNNVTVGSGAGLKTKAFVLASSLV